jgi:hypothetical protein
VLRTSLQFLCQTIFWSLLQGSRAPNRSCLCHLDNKDNFASVVLRRSCKVTLDGSFMTVRNPTPLLEHPFWSIRGGDQTRPVALVIRLPAGHVPQERAFSALLMNELQLLSMRPRTRPVVRCGGFYGHAVRMRKIGNMKLEQFEPDLF